MALETGIHLDTAAIVSTALQGVLYGISIVMFIGTIWALTYRRTHCSTSRISGMVIIACLMLLFSTAHLIVDIIRTYEGLVQYRNSFQPDGPIGFFSDVTQWSFVYKSLLYTLQTLVGDGVVIHRCYVVWQSWLVVVFPIVLWVSIAVTGIGRIYYDTYATINSEDVLAASTGPWIPAFLAATLFANIICTSLLAFRMWRVGRHLTDTILQPILRIVLDSGIFYSVSLLSALVCFVAKNRGHYVLIDMMMPIISITFYMVIIRITVAKSNSQDTRRPSLSDCGGPALFCTPRLDRERGYQTKCMDNARFTEASKIEYGGREGEPKQHGETEGQVNSATEVWGSSAV